MPPYAKSFCEALAEYMREVLPGDRSILMTISSEFAEKKQGHRFRRGKPAILVGRSRRCSLLRAGSGNLHRTISGVSV
jgi:hypothetical protein